MSRFNYYLVTGAPLLYFGWLRLTSELRPLCC